MSVGDYPTEPRHALRRLASLGLALAALCAAGCDGGEDDAPDLSAEGIVAAEGASEPGEAQAPEDPATIPQPDGPRLGATELKTPIYAKPTRSSDIIGYLRAGATVARGEKPVAYDDCDAGYYRILPAGFVCAEEYATLDMEHPILRAIERLPDRSKPMPYPYAFVRAIAPRYYRVPTKEEQFKYEMSLERHLRGYEKLAHKWDALSVGANDLELDAEGNAIGLAPDLAPELDYNAYYGGNGSDEIPWWLQDGRQINNISSFKVPPYAVITNRIKRKAMLALIGTFMGPNDRRFAVTPDLRLVPTSKLKPDRGSVFHGVDLRGGWHLPMAWVKRDKVHSYDLSRKAFDKADKLERQLPVQLTGEFTHLKDERMLELIDGTYVKESDIAVAPKPGKLPPFAKKGERWIDVSIFSQTLVLYEGETPVYATMVSTGRDGIGEPGKTLSTPTGTFRIWEKHVTTVMDSSEVGNEFELQDVPWVQYFKGGYALHAAPWHDDYGRPRSHGCINLSPIDARRIFNFTDPPMPEDWHGVDAHEATGEGTLIHIHP